MSEVEQDMFLADGLDPQDLLEVQENVNKIKEVRLMVSDQVDVMMGEAQVELRGGSSNPPAPLPCPKGKTRSRCLIWSCWA